MICPFPLLPHSIPSGTNFLTLPHQHTSAKTAPLLCHSPSSPTSAMRKQAAPPAASPERSRPWSNPTPPPPSPKHHPSRRIPVVYYLCRNRHLEHPHFIEVPLSSPNGLYLRDVINRLITLRGKSMPAMYSWSCKRSYKSGFVWHDLSEDDLIVPSQGNEYVLKGSELLDQSPPDRSSVSRTQEPAPAPEPQPQPQEAVNSQHPCSSSDDSTRPETSSPGPVEYRVYKPHCAADASTQTEDAGGGRRTSGSPNMCVRGVSTDEGSSQDRNEISSTPSSTSSSGKTAQTATLESLIRAEASKMNSFRILEGQEEVLMPAAAAKLKATDMLIQLITCGSISVKDHGSFGLVPTYLPRFSRVRFPSPMFVGSMAAVEELDRLSENPRMVGLRIEDKEYFSGSLIESKAHKEDLREAVLSLKRSSSFDALRNCESPDSNRDKEKDSTHSKCIPRSVKMTSNKQSRNEATKSPLSDCQRNSSASTDCSLPSKGVSRKTTNASSVKGSSMRLESFKEEKGRVIKIEERLTSGARVIIQSRVPCEDSEGSSSS